MAAAGKHLALVGLMGAGKTTVGQGCAARLDRPFVDTDQMVEASTGRTVAQIFEHDGEATFRALERGAVADACASPTPLVIACGGGAVLDAGSRRALRGTSVVVWLRAAPAELGARVGMGDDRPLLRRDAGTVAALERLMALRVHAYEAAADIPVDTDGLTVDDVVARVTEEWRAWNA
jgi:shikimate kinase